MSVESNIVEKLTRELLPSHLEVVNESHMHSVPPGSESHFRVVVACAEFEKMPRVRRHQRVYQLLAEELRTGVHALALHTYSLDEWQAGAAAKASPPCLGGAKTG